MRITGHKTAWGGRFRLPLMFVASVLAGASLAAQEPPPPAWFVTIAHLAASLSQNDSVGAMQAFDRGAKDYATIESSIEALVSQTEILCAIDPVQDKEQGKEQGKEEDKESGGFHDLDVDWYMQLKSPADGGPIERRRERVQIRVKQTAPGKWKIISLSPLDILAPIRIQ